MPRRRIPQYRCYKPKNLGLVVVHGKAHYLGPYGSEESWERYHRLIADLLVSPSASSPAPTQPEAQTGPTVDELLVRFWDCRVTTYYVKNVSAQ